MNEQGWAFPVQVNEVAGTVLNVSETDMIRQSIALILMTQKGERFLYPDFGCNLRRFVFKGTDYTTLKEIEKEVAVCINAWEDRIDRLSVKASVDPRNRNRINIDIGYVIRKTGLEVAQTYGFESQ